MDDSMQGFDESMGWGPAERAAVDRCLDAPLFSVSEVLPKRPVRISRLIETEIIPRLMLAHCDGPPAIGGGIADKDDAAAIAGHSIGSDPDAVHRYVETLFARGCSIDTLLLDALAPAARLLGDMWSEDLCTFMDVTIGLGRLQHVLRVVGNLVESERSGPVAGRLLLAAVPGEQHAFGVSALELFFRQAGWDVRIGRSDADLHDAAGDEWFDIIGLSLSSDILFHRVAPLIHSLRRTSRNPSVFMMVGGRFFVDNPDRSADAGADAAASDAHDALRLAHSRFGLPLASC